MASIASSDEQSGREKPFRVFFIPFFMHSHMFPMVELARLFATRPGVQPTFVLTPANAADVRPALDRSAADGRPIGLALYPFPSVGLPEGVENLGTAPASQLWRVYKAVDLVVPSLEKILRQHRPDAIVADLPYWWTGGIAADLGIPRINFNVFGVFSQLVLSKLFRIRSEIRGRSTIVVPDMPGRPIEIPPAELPRFLKDPEVDWWGRMGEARPGCIGEVVNTFYELEQEYHDDYQRMFQLRSWFFCPIPLAMRSITEKGGRAGNREEEDDDDKCLRWLNSREESSVVFVCFGSWCNFTGEQLREVALGLEASGRSFLWAMKKGGGDQNDAREDNSWMPEGLEERVAGRGLVVSGWAPQMAILRHPAVGAFLSHCGWNSVVETLTVGVPMLTWPLAFDHFIIERFVVGVKGVGKRVWEGPRSEAEGETTLVPREAIARAVSHFMEKGGEGEMARKKARELSAVLKVAMKEGGSSRRSLEGLIDEMLATRVESSRPVDA